MEPVAEHNRAKHGDEDEEVEIEVKMRGRGHSGGWVSSLTLAIFAVYSSSGWVHRFTYGGPGAGFPGVTAVRSESAVYWRAGSHRASAAGKALGPDFLGSLGDNLPTRPEHGVVLARINPFGTTVAPTKFVASGLTTPPAISTTTQSN